MEPHQESLTQPEVNALLEALDDEFKAVATYQQVIDDFGPIRPFVNIIEAERRHIEALRGLFNRYNLHMPANSWPDAAARFESVGDACAAGVEGEIDNAAMYQRLIGATHHTDIIEVFENFQRASQDNSPPRLPAMHPTRRRTTPERPPETQTTSRELGQPS